MVHSTMTEFQLVRLRSAARQYLSPEADSIIGNEVLDQCFCRLDRVPALLGLRVRC